MADVVDFEQRDEGMMVSRGICDQLDDMKHEYAGLPDFLTRVRLPFVTPCKSATSRGSTAICCKDPTPFALEINRFPVTV